MILPTALAGLTVFLAVLLVVYIVIRPSRPRGIAGKRDPHYQGIELPDTPFVAQPEEPTESGIPWSVSRKLERGEPLTDAEEWTILMAQEWTRLR